MKDLPIKPLQTAVSRTLLPQTANSVAASDLAEPIAEIAKSADASIINVPRTKALAPASDAGAVLESFLTEIHNQKDIVSAHGGLDASRVFDLLSDSED